MFCNVCGAKTDENSRFCPVCGAGLADEKIIHQNFDDEEDDRTYLMTEEPEMYNRDTIRAYGTYQNDEAIAAAGLESSPAVSSGNVYRLITPGFVIGVVSAVFMVIGLFLPAIDFSAFNSSVNLQYSLIKICKNVALISPMWRAIPVGFLIAAAMMLGLSFVKTPVFRIIPCILALAMFALMLLDLGNIIEWVNNVLEKFFETGKGAQTTDVERIRQIVSSLMYGIYFLVSGIIAGIISIFCK
jgi:hypothetical protein